MKKLTDKELVIMNVLWENGALSMRDIMEKMPETKALTSTRYPLLFIAWKPTA